MLRISRVQASIGKYLDTSGECHRCGSKHETEEYTSDRSEMDPNLAETRVYCQIHNGNENNKCKGIDVLQEIVRDPVSFHLTGLRDQVIEHLIVTHPIDWEENENTTGDQRSTNFVDKQIVPRGVMFVATNGPSLPDLNKANFGVDDKIINYVEFYVMIL